MTYRVPSLLGRDVAGRDPMDSLRQEMDRLFDAFGRQGGAFSAGKDGRILPELDWAETDKDIVVTAEVPGVDPKDVDVQLKNSTLHIRAEKRSERDEKKADYQVCERSFGFYERAIGVPEGIDPKKVTAKVDRGVLTVTLPKPPQVAEQGHKIKIAAS